MHAHPSKKHFKSLWSVTSCFLQMLLDCSHGWSVTYGFHICLLTFFDPIARAMVCYDLSIIVIIIIKHKPNRNHKYFDDDDDDDLQHLYGVILSVLKNIQEAYFDYMDSWMCKSRSINHIWRLCVCMQPVSY